MHVNLFSLRMQMTITDRIKFNQVSIAVGLYEGIMCAMSN